MITITYFVHGTTLDNEQNIATGWAQGELSEIGIQQAIDLGVQTREMSFDAVFCSDLKRAVDSTLLAFEDNYTIIQDSRLREANYGDLNQHHESKFTFDKYWCIDNQFPNGESYKDVERRLADFIQYLRNDCTYHHIAIVAHKAPQLALDVLLGGKTWEQAINGDWRLEKKWQLGWKYTIK